MESLDDRKLLAKMLTIRILEDKLQELCYAGEAGDLHFNKGQEAISVGASEALLPTDYVVTHHRTIAHAVAQGVPLRPLVAEVLGRKSGVNGGMAGEMHVSYPPVRYLFSFQIVGTCVPVAAGIAWSVKNYLKSKDIVACFVGDAASSNGQFHEGLNIASVRSVPLLLICENNELAGNIRPEFYLPTKSVAERAAAYGIESSSADGNRVDEVVDAVREAADKVRRNSKPYLLEFHTTRLCWHKQGQSDARSKEELAELAKRDPLTYEEKRLGITTKERESLESSVSRVVNDAIEYALKEPYPESPSAGK
jgi:TPP-dependent pyruvate/acetoin dehydrogenase alpha subunit